MRFTRNLSVGEWQRGTKHGKGYGGLVHVTVQKGRHWSIHGHTHNSSTVLLPEEALFLMECGALKITSSGRILSLQEAYHSLLSGLQLHFYQVYASLKRIGFIAHRVYLSSVMELLEVYKPSGSDKSSPYKKSHPGPPHFRVLVARKDDVFPSGEEVRRLCQLQPLASVNICIVDGSHLTYYSLETL